MGIRSEESIALGKIADKLQSLDNTMRRIEMDLHSIDISLGAMKSENINDRRQNYWNWPVPDITCASEASEISKNQEQMVENVCLYE